MRFRECVRGFADEAGSVYRFFSRRRCRAHYAGVARCRCFFAKPAEILWRRFDAVGFHFLALRGPGDFDDDALAAFY